MGRKEIARAKEVLINIMPYRRHYISFFERMGEFHFTVTQEPPTVELASILEIDSDFETFEITTNLSEEDFFDKNLFRNAKAVYRFAKQVTARKNAA